jgi:hypothetical protein
MVMRVDERYGEELVHKTKEYTSQAWNSGNKYRCGLLRIRRVDGKPSIEWQTCCVPRKGYGCRQLENELSHIVCPRYLRHLVIDV